MGFGWFYYFILGTIGIFLGVFGSVFNTASALYNAKDNDLLLSMPIPVSYIMVSRLFTVFFTGALYSGVVVIPAAVMFLITNGVTFAKLAGGILFILLVFLAVFLLSCVLGYVVAAVSSRLKNKSVITVIISLAFFAVYYFVYFKASELIGDIVENAVLYGDAVKEAFYPAYLFGSCGMGETFSLLISFGVVLVALAIICCLIARSFLKIVTKIDSAAVMTEKRKTRMKSKGVFSSLAGREFSRFFSSANYMLNCGIGAVLAVLAAVFLFIKREGLTAAVTVSLFSGWIFAVVLGGGGYFLGRVIGYAASIALLTAVMFVAFALLFGRLMKKGTEAFETL